MRLGHAVGPGGRDAVPPAQRGHRAGVVPAVERVGAVVGADGERPAHAGDGVAQGRQQGGVQRLEGVRLGGWVAAVGGLVGRADVDHHAPRAALDGIDRRAGLRVQIGVDVARRARRDEERVVVHVGAPDEAAHRRDTAAKAGALEALDAVLLTPLRDAVARAGGTLAVCPDHGTDPLVGAHDAAAVPALRWGAGIAPAGPRRMTEAACARAPVRPPAWPLYGAARVEAAA